MNAFAPCEICGTTDWRAVYTGPIRDGTFGNFSSDATVARCAGCGTDRLREDFCFDESGYATGDYRQAVGQATDTGAYQATHDPLQRFTIDALSDLDLRGKVVADIGCAGGSFLDHVAGLAAELVAVEPARHYHDDLTARGFSVFAGANDAAAAGVSVDVAVSAQVIEHVANPRVFLSEIATMLAPGGAIVITTPNRADVLMDLMPEDFPAFFYRTVHRWYFDAASLAACGVAAGLTPSGPRYVHRYPMANALHWLRDRRPRGRTPMPPLDALADGFWQSYLESTGRADQLAMTFRTP